MEKNENLLKNAKDENSSFESLPREIKQHIFSFFSEPQDLARVRSVNKGANTLAKKASENIARKAMHTLSDKNKMQELSIEEIEKNINLLINLGYKFDAYRLLQDIYADEYKQKNFQILLANSVEQFQVVFILNGIYGADFEPEESSDPQENIMVRFGSVENHGQDTKKLLALEKLLQDKFKLAGHVNAEFLFGMADILSCDSEKRFNILSILFVIKTLLEKHSENSLIKEEFALINQYFASCLKNCSNSFSFARFGESQPVLESLTAEEQAKKYSDYDIQLKSGGNKIEFYKQDEQVYFGLFTLIDFIEKFDNFFHEKKYVIERAKQWLEKNEDLFKTDDNKPSTNCLIM